MTAKPAQRPKIFFGWWIASGGFVVQMLVGSLMFHSFGAYVVLLQREFDWSRTTFSLAFAFARAESGILGPFQGWLIDTYGPRKVMFVGMVLFGVGFMAFSFVNSIWTFYAAFLFLSIGASLASFLSLVVSLVNWFRRRRALALSFLSLGFAVGGFTAPLLALIMEEAGWRATAFGSGVLVLLVGLPLSALVRHRPEPYGYLPDGERTPDGVLPEDWEADDAEIELTVREALRTRAFWLLSFGQASALLVIGALMVHLQLFIEQDLGYALSLAALAITVQTVGQIFGQFIGAYLGDRLPKRPLIVAAMLGHASAIFILAFADTLPLIYFAVAVNGTAWGLRAPILSAMRADYFGRKSFGTIMGFSSLIIMLGMIIGPLFAGQMYDSTGSYSTSFIVLGAVAALGSLLFVFATPPERPQPSDETPQPRRAPAAAAPTGGP